MDTNTLAALRATHQLYCQLTGQNLTLRFDRERLWHEFLRAGFSAQDLKTVVAYLQKEIRASRRNVGALKLSNLLQLDRFEEDLNISKVRLRSAPPSDSSRSTPPIRHHLRLLNSRTCVSRPRRLSPACARNSAKLPTLDQQTLETKPQGEPDSAHVVITVRKLPQIARNGTVLFTPEHG